MKAKPSDMQATIAEQDEHLPVPQSRQAIQAKTASKPGKVTGKLLVALKAIVWEGQDLDVAAKGAGLTTRNLRLALDRPHVRQFLKAERDVFREHACAQNIHRLKNLRDGSGNAMAKLGAIKVLEQIGDEPGAQQGRVTTPGIVILVGSGAALTSRQHRNDDKLLINQQVVHQVGPIGNGTDSESEPT